MTTIKPFRLSIATDYLHVDARPCSVKWHTGLGDDWEEVPRLPPLPVVPDDLAGDVVQEDLANGSTIRLEADGDIYVYAVDEWVVDLEAAR